LSVDSPLLSGNIAPRKITGSYIRVMYYSGQR